jgi:hypothetical protein
LSFLSAIGDVTGLKAQRGLLFEYSLEKGLVLEFEFNPSSITRTRSVTVKTPNLSGARGGYDFNNPSEAPRAAQGVTVASESFSIKILLDATDRMDAGDPEAGLHGIQPELDVIRMMLEPKSQQPQGARTLAALGKGSEKSFSQYQALSVLIFKWGIHTLPVFLTLAQIEIKGYLPSLIPYRAEVTLSLQLIESDNPFYAAEIMRQTLSAAANTKNVLASAFVPGL